MKEFIYASYLRITPEEFFDLAAKEMSKAYESYKSSSEAYKDPFLQFWVYINPNLIPDSYIDTLKRVLIDEYGWRIVDIEKQFELGYKQPIKKKRIEVEIVEWIRLHKGIIILVYPFTNKEGEKRFIFAIPMENGSLSSNNLNYPSYEQARLEGIKSVCNELLRK